MIVNLVMFTTDGRRKDFAIGRKATVIGRGEDCGLRVPLLDVSRHHCQISQNEDKLVVKDLSSSNGTFVNAKRVQESVVKAGDRLAVGPVVFTVQIDGKPEEVAAPAPEPKPAPKSVDKAAAKPAAKSAGKAAPASKSAPAAKSKPVKPAEKTASKPASKPARPKPGEEMDAEDIISALIDEEDKDEDELEDDAKGAAKGAAKDSAKTSEELDEDTLAALGNLAKDEDEDK